MDSFEALCRNQKLGLWWKNRIKYLADDNRQRDARALFLEFKNDERIIRTWLWPFPWLCSRACRLQSSGWIRLWNALNNSKNYSWGAPGMVCIVVTGRDWWFFVLKKESISPYVPDVWGFRFVLDDRYSATGNSADLGMHSTAHCNWTERKVIVFTSITDVSLGDKIAHFFQATGW